MTTSYDTTPGGIGATTGNTFLARANDTFEIVYTDELRADGSSGEASALDAVEGGTPGTVGIVAGLPGDDLTLTLTDADRPGTDSGDGRRPGGRDRHQHLARRPRRTPKPSPCARPRPARAATRARCPPRSAPMRGRTRATTRAPW